VKDQLVCLYLRDNRPHLALLLAVLAMHMPIEKEITVHCVLSYC